MTAHRIESDQDRLDLLRDITDESLAAAHGQATRREAEELREQVAVLAAECDRLREQRDESETFVVEALEMLHEERPDHAKALLRRAVDTQRKRYQGEEGSDRG